jgi:restriction system protein
VAAKVDKDGLRSFLALVGDEDVGIFVAAGGFTRDAEEFARGQERRRITLVDLERLVDLWVAHYAKLSDVARRRMPLTPIYFLTPQA